MEAPVRAQSVMNVETRSSFFSKTFSKLRRKKGSITNNSNNNPYSNGVGESGAPFAGKRFMSQPMLSLGRRDSTGAEGETSSTSTTDGRERRSADLLRTQPPVTSAPRRSVDVRVSSGVRQSTPKAAAAPPPAKPKPHSITTALISGANVGVSVVDGLPSHGDHSSFVFPASTPKPSAGKPATTTSPATANGLPRPSTATVPRPPPPFVRMPSSTSPFASARLSPTLITRAPMPILNLPPLPIPSAPTPSTAGRSGGLRNMPALHRQGTVDDNANDGDNDDSSGSDGEGDDGFVDADEGEGEGESEDGHAQEIPEAGQQTPRRRMQLPSLELGSWGNLLGGGLTQTPTQHESAQTPTDYFSSSSRMSRRSSVITPGSILIPQTPTAQTPRIPESPLATVRMPQTPGSDRMQPPATPTSSILMSQTPGMGRNPIYKHASRSMINILGPAMTRREGAEDDEDNLATTPQPSTPKPQMLPISVPSPATPSPASPIPATAAPKPTRRQSNATIARRRSLPTFTAPGSPPPPYPSFAPHWRGGAGHGVSVHPPTFDAVHRHQNTPDDDDDDNGIMEVPRNPRQNLERDADGADGEVIPVYTNEIYLRAVMPRKMEFTAPGVQARDRKWRRVVCELEGTVLRIFEDASSNSGIGAWWERRVGVGDVSSGAPTTALAAHAAARANAVNENSAPADRDRDEPKSGEVNVGGRGTTELTIPSPTPIHSRSAPAQISPPPPQSRSILGRILTHGRSWSDIPSPNGTSPPQPGRASLNIPDDGRRRRSGEGRSRFGSSLNAGPPSMSPSVSTSSAASSTSSPRSEFSASSTASDSDSCSHLKLLHAYTLQHAESGLGNDYLKRKNVIRVRMEGEQFLLQAEDVGSVVGWIEGLHAAANVALDLDERPMPRGPLFPRRRRRRRQATTGATTTATTTTAAGS